jgi:hypothetical protein
MVFCILYKRLRSERSLERDLEELVREDVDEFDTDEELERDDDELDRDEDEFELDREE